MLGGYSCLWGITDVDGTDGQGFSRVFLISWGLRLVLNYPRKTRLETNFYQDICQKFGNHPPKPMNRLCLCSDVSSDFITLISGKIWRGFFRRIQAHISSEFLEATAPMAVWPHHYILGPDVSRWKRRQVCQPGFFLPPDLWELLKMEIPHKWTTLTLNDTMFLKRKVMIIF